MLAVQALSSSEPLCWILRMFQGCNLTVPTIKQMHADKGCQTALKGLAVLPLELNAATALSVEDILGSAIQTHLITMPAHRACSTTSTS